MRLTASYTWQTQTGQAHAVGASFERCGHCATFAQGLQRHTPHAPGCDLPTVTSPGQRLPAQQRLAPPSGARRRPRPAPPPLRQRQKPAAGDGLGEQLSTRLQRYGERRAGPCTQRRRLCSTQSRPACRARPQPCLQGCREALRRRWHLGQAVLVGGGQADLHQGQGLRVVSAGTVQEGWAQSFGVAWPPGERCSQAAGAQRSGPEYWLHASVALLLIESRPASPPTPPPPPPHPTTTITTIPTPTHPPNPRLACCMMATTSAYAARRPSCPAPALLLASASASAQYLDGKAEGGR